MKVQYIIKIDGKCVGFCEKRYQKTSARVYPRKPSLVVITNRWSKIGKICAHTTTKESYFGKRERPYSHTIVDHKAKIDGKISVSQQSFKFDSKEIIYRIKKRGQVVDEKRILRTDDSAILDSDYSFLKTIGLLTGESKKIKLFDIALARFVDADISRRIDAHGKAKGPTKGIVYHIAYEGRKDTVCFKGDLVVRAISILADETTIHQIWKGKGKPRRLIGADYSAALFHKCTKKIGNGLTLTRLGFDARLQLIGDYAENVKLRDPGLGQDFKGRYDNRTGIIQGQFNIKRIPFAMQQTNKRRVSEGRRYLVPENNVETNTSRIKSLAASLANSEKTLVGKAKRVVAWVYNNISYAVFSPSAIDTLTNRASDCGGKANLTTALLRCIGIPARTVGGIVYFGGIFAQHYWTEFVDNNGKWISTDPTLGEFGFINAGHVKLFEGSQCGVHVYSLKVSSYSHFDALILLKPFSTPILKPLSYLFRQGRKIIGINRNTFTYNGAQKLHSEFVSGNFQKSSVLTTGHDIFPIRFSSLDQDGNKLDVDFSDSAHMRLVNSDSPPRTVPPGRTLCLDNNMVGHYALVLAAIIPKAQNMNIYNVFFNAFVPELNRVTPIYLNCLGTPEWIKINGTPARGMKIKLLDKNAFLDQKGLLMGLDEPNGVIIRRSMRRKYG